MAGFSSLADLRTEAFTNGKVFLYQFSKTSSAPEAGGVLHSLWTAAGAPAAGSNPAGFPGAACTNLAGSINFPDTSPDLKYLATIQVTATQDCGLLLLDRLSHASGWDLFAGGAFAVSTTALPRYTDGVDVQCYCEVTTVTATTAPVVRMSSYTDDGNNAAQNGVNRTFPAAATNAGCFIGPMNLASGDSGVRAVAEITHDSAASAGTGNLVLAKPIAFMGLRANRSRCLNFFVESATMPRIYDGASLMLAIWPSGTTAVTISGCMEVIYG